MPRGGKREGADAPARKKPRGGKRKGAGGSVGNSNSAGNKSGASVGNTNSSSREKKISNLFEEGCAFDRHSDDVNALFKFRKVIELEPLHADSNYCIGRLLAHKFLQGDFISSGSFSQLCTSELRIVVGANKRRLVSSNF